MPRGTVAISYAVALVAGVAMMVSLDPAGRPGIGAGMLAVSFVLLILGADLMVHGAVVLARQLGVSPFFIGVTVVAFGTSAPELAASVGAALDGTGELAIGNVLGSNIANIGLILGVTALVRPVPVERSVWRVDAPLMLAVTVLASLTMLDRLFNPDAVLGRVDGVVLLLGLVAYVWYNARAGRIDPEEIEHEVEIELGEQASRASAFGRVASLSAPVLQVVSGLAGLIVGAGLLVDGAKSIAASIGVSEAIIGLSVVAFGTSVPELVFSVRAAMKDHPEIAVGNIIGSNVFNLLSVLGVAALARPLDIPAEAVRRDIWVVWAATLLCVVMMKSKRGVSRVESTALLLGYLAYVVVIYIT